MDWLQVAIQGGAVGIALVLAVLSYKERAEQRKEMSELIERNTSAHVEHAKAISALTASLPHVCQFKK